MKKIETNIPGVVILEPVVFGDARGWFSESWNERVFNELVGSTTFVQDNESYSQHGVLRGLHFQTGDSAQAKLVRVLSGAVLDVAVDIRFGSPTFGQYASVELTSENHRQLFIPKGFAHGFVVLSESAHFAYKCDAFYAPGQEGSISAEDPDLDIYWKVPLKDRLMSSKDMAAQSFAAYCKNPAFQFSRSDTQCF